MLFYGVGAVLAAAATGAVFAAPYDVELLWGSFNKSWVVGKDAGLEISAVTAFHANSGSGQIGAADIGRLKVEDPHVEVYPQAEHPLQSCL